MGKRETDFAEVLRALGTKAGLEVSEHPTAEELIAYQEKRLSEERRQSIQTHLVVCADCSRSVLDLASFPSLELRSPGHQRSASDEEEDWRLIEERLAAASREEPQPESSWKAPSELRKLPRDEPGRIPPRKRISVWLPAAAVILFTTTLGLTALVMDLQRRLGESSRTEELGTNIHFQELVPIGEASRRSTHAVRVVVPAGTNWILLFLTTERFENFESYQAELVSETDEKRLQFHGLVQGADGAFSIQLPRRELPAGGYRVELFGITDSTRIPLESYRFFIEYIPV